MAYDTVKSGLATRLNTLGLIESSQAVDFKNAPANEYGNRYIIKCLSGENKENTIIERFDDAQDWQILVAFARSENNDIIKLDELHRIKDKIIKDIDKPANWESIIAKLVKYNKWEYTEYPNYYVLSIRLFILDQYIYN